MSENLTINKSDIASAMIYDWVCPECNADNEIYGEEPTSDYPLTCENCGSSADVID